MPTSSVLSSVDDDERRVFYIVSSPLRLVEKYQELHGVDATGWSDEARRQTARLLEWEVVHIPAFDAQDRLVGFYSETKDARTHAMTLEFTALSASLYANIRDN